MELKDHYTPANGYSRLVSPPSHGLEAALDEFEALFATVARKADERN